MTPSASVTATSANPSADPSAARAALARAVSQARLGEPTRWRYLFHLPLARPMVRNWCAQAGVHYHCVSPGQAWREVLSALHRVGHELRRGARAG